MKAKILVVHNEYQHRGGEDVVFEQERRLLERHGHPVAIYRRSNREIDKLTQLGRVALAGRAVWSADTRAEFLDVLRREKPALVHVHNTFMMISPSIYSACREAGVPVVQTLHNYRVACPAANFFRGGQVCEECVEHGPWRSLRYGCYRESRLATAASALVVAVHQQLGTWDKMVDGFLALSHFARQKFIAAGLPETRLHVKPNFVDPDPGPGDQREAYAVWVGRLSPEKGLSTLLEAWQMVGALPLLIVGDGPLRAELEAEAARRRIAGIVFRGHLDRAETTRIIQQSRLLVHTSACYENFPMSIAEAFACATPVICARLGAMEEIVTDGVTGWHYTPGNAADLAATVARAWKRPRLLAEMGLRLRAEYQEKYTAEANYARLMEIYGAAEEYSRSAPQAGRANAEFVGGGRH